jgi:hypothetical protein
MNDALCDFSANHMNIRGLAPLLQVFGMPTLIVFYRDIIQDPDGYVLCFQWPVGENRKS